MAKCFKKQTMVIDNVILHVTVERVCPPKSDEKETGHLLLWL